MAWRGWKSLFEDLYQTTHPSPPDFTFSSNFHQQRKVFHHLWPSSTISAIQWALSGAKESSLWRTPGPALPQALLGHGGGGTYIFISWSNFWNLKPQKSFNAMLKPTLLKNHPHVETYLYSGRSANVRASLGTVHSFSLCYVQLHQVASPGVAGDF